MTDNTGRAHVRAEESHIVETLALPPGLLASDLPSNAKRQEIDVPLNGFQVNRVLTEAECDRLVAVAEKKGFDSIAWEYDPNYRSCTRLVVKVPELAAELWRRIRAHLHVEDIADARPFGYGISTRDVWRPYGINECMRFTKYTPGDHFGALPIAKTSGEHRRNVRKPRHRDGAFVLTDEERSVHTVMVYLNKSENYAGGETIFYAFNKETDKPDAIFTERASVKGAKGDALIFQHPIWHEGRRLVSGVKYILRTDLMFVRVASAPLSSSLQYSNLEKFNEAEELYQKSIRLQKEGDPAGSTAAYLAALDIHATLETMTPQYGEEYRRVPPDVMVSEVLARLSLRDLLRGVWCVSRGWRALAKHPLLWKRLYRDTFLGPDFVSADNVPMALRHSYKIPLKDWYTLYKTRSIACRKFQVIYADLGSMFLRFGIMGQEKTETTLSLVAAVPGHYWTHTNGLEQHLCGFNVFARSQTEPLWVMNPAILLRWMLLEGFGSRLLPLEHPLLLARPAEFTDSDCTYVGDVMRTLVGVPYVAFVDQAICTLAALDRSSGLVLSINRHSVVATAVLNAHVVSRRLLPLSSGLPFLVAKAMSFTRAVITPARLEGAIGQIITGLVAMTMLVLQDLKTLPPEHRTAILTSPVIRGVYAELAKSKLEAALAAKMAGVVSKLDSRSSTMVEMREGKEELTASTDVLLGLKKLCYSVGSAVRLFASVEPPVVRFTKTLLIIVTPDGDVAELKPIYHPNERHYTSGEVSADTIALTEQQVKVFRTVQALDDWWRAFAQQLAVSMRNGLVRVLYASDFDEETNALQELIKWKRSIGSALPLLVWREWATNARGTDIKAENLYYGNTSRWYLLGNYTKAAPPFRHWTKNLNALYQQDKR